MEQKHYWTVEQTSVVEAVLDGQSVLVNSVAGSGKTATGVAAIRILPPSTNAMCLAFNARVAKELLAKMPDNATCKTFNSIGLGSWFRKANDKCVTDKKKSYRVRDSLDIKYDWWPAFPRALSALRTQGLCPPSSPIQGNSILKWEPETVLDIVDRFDAWPDTMIESREQVLDYLEKAMATNIQWAWKGDLDFDDQLYMPALFAGPFSCPDVLVVDEVQDVSPIQRHLIKRIIKGGDTKILALGDPNQAIYAFRGADFRAVSLFEMEFECTPMSLSISFRCPKAVVKVAKRYVPHMEPHESAPEGLVEHHGDDWTTTMFSPGDVILCRNNAPLIALCFRLIANHIPAAVLGHEIGKGLVKLAENMKCQRTDALASKLATWGREEIYKLRMKERNGAASALSDRIECLTILCNSMPNRSTKDLTRKIHEMFDDKKASLILSTVHKAKGLEWNRVFFLDSHLIPSRFATTEDQIQQEENVFYVAVTRARRELHFINS